MKLLKNIILLNILLFITIINVNAKETATVIIGYNDINGHVLKEKHDNCVVGEEYTSSAITISGYELTSETPSKQTIYCDSEFQNNIAFVYQVKGNSKEGSVKAHYIDSKGNKISEPDLRSGTPGVDYYITPKVIKGYTLIKTDGENNGKFKEGEITIKFIYQKDNVDNTPDKVETPIEQKKEETKKIVTKKQPVKSTKTTTKKVEVKEDVKKEEPIKEENPVFDNSLIIKQIESVFNKQNITKPISNNKFYYRIGLYFMTMISISLFVLKKTLFK